MSPRGRWKAHGKQGEGISVQAWGGWGRDTASCTETQDVAHRMQRKQFSFERAADWLSDPWSELCFDVDFLLGAIERRQPGWPPWPQIRDLSESRACACCAAEKS